jgi:hypothetical protein
VDEKGDGVETQDWKKKCVGRSQARWMDDIRRVARGGWMRVAQDRESWKSRGEAYVQYWTRDG